MALRNRLVATDAGWKTVKAFADVSRSRKRDLMPRKEAALLAECDPHLAAFVTAIR